MADAVEAGQRIRAIFKEPTVTPSAEQAKEWGLKKQLPSPNGYMRRGWNGITISRDTIHIPGIELGYKRPVLFERHAVGGEYGAGWNTVGRGRLLTTFFPDDPTVQPTVVDGRHLGDTINAAVVYHNPLDNVGSLAEVFFDRCLLKNVTPYVVTKKTVFKWQEGFWQAMEKVFNEKYIDKFREQGLLDRCNGKLNHLISDAATMQIIRWTDGGFGMACHNYDGDMLTDEVAQVHRSPGFITSNLIGKANDGTLIKEYEASHGTVADLWEAHQRGEATSMNPLGMVEALCSAIEYSGELTNNVDISTFGSSIRTAMHNCFIEGEGTRDMQGPEGLTTEQFVDAVARRLDRDSTNEQCIVGACDVNLSRKAAESKRASRKSFVEEQVDEAAMQTMFNEYDLDGDGRISIDEFSAMCVKLNIAPLKEGKRKSTLKEIR